MPPQMKREPNSQSSTVELLEEPTLFQKTTGSKKRGTRRVPTSWKITQIALGLSGIVLSATISTVLGDTVYLKILALTSVLISVSGLVSETVFVRYTNKTIIQMYGVAALFFAAGTLFGRPAFGSALRSAFNHLKLWLSTPAHFSINYFHDKMLSDEVISSFTHAVKIVTSIST